MNVQERERERENVVNVQVGGGRAATTFRRYIFKSTTK